MQQTKMMQQNQTIYEKNTLMKTDMATMFDFHQKSEALAKLTPPPIFVQLHRDDRTSITEGELEFTLWFGFIPIRWIARHEPGPTETSFADRMTKGPLAHWRHEHIFTQQEAGVLLTDRVTITHKDGFKGIITRLMFDGLPLKMLFFYRHLITKRVVE